MRVVMVATSNLHPSELYKDGLNRGLFLPFLTLLQKHCDVVRLDARTDFRLEKLTGMPTWHAPTDATARDALDEAWRRLADNEPGKPHDLIVKGRIVKVPQAAMGVARFFSMISAPGRWAPPTTCESRTNSTLSFLRISR
jgi:cell division protein ZapE